MLRIAISFLFACILFGCDSATTVEEQKMTVAPLALVFEPGETVKTLSITHNCTCPFTWSGMPASTDTSHVLKAFSGKGDDPAVEVSIQRDSLRQDTLNTSLMIASNYGNETVEIRIIR